MPYQLPRDKVNERLQQILRLLEKQQLVEELVHRQDSPKQALIDSLTHRQHLVELQTRLARIHPADIAYILEALSPEQRLLVWHQVSDRRKGHVLLEVSDAVREFLIAVLSRDELIAALAPLDADELSEVADDIPADILEQSLSSRNAADRDWLRSSLAYPEGSVGEAMSQDMLLVSAEATLEDAVAGLRGRGRLPEQTDKLFVVDRRHVLKGALPLPDLLLHDAGTRVDALMATDVVSFSPTEDAGTAAQAFERYDLVSAPVLDGRGKIIGRLTVDAMLDTIREQADEQALNRAGLREEEDLFAPIWDSARNRSLWLFINLVTAFLASRVIGLFSNTIEQLVALATLMPIVAGIGGNTGNQTIALVIRGLATGQITSGNISHLISKELTVSLLNGAVWGSLMGLFAYLLYHNARLGLVMAAAICLNLLVAALIGALVPITLKRLGRDPALGSSVLLTFTTDSMGFFIFLGLASAVLL